MNLRSRISPSEAQEIFSKAMVAINDYNNARYSGTLTTDEKLKIAEEALETVTTVIKDLE